MKNYTADTDFIANFATSVSQNCYQDSHTQNITNIIIVIFNQKCLDYYIFYSKSSQDLTI